MLDSPQPYSSRTSIKASRAIIWLCLAFIAAFVTWAANVEVDQISRAQGIVIPSSRLQTVQAQEQAVVKQVYVELGGRVEAGQLLIEFEDDRARAAVEEAIATLQVLRALKERLTAELEGRAPSFDEDLQAVPEVIESQRQLYERRVTAYEEEIEGRQRLLELVTAELAANKPLLDTGDVGLAEVMRLERAVAQADVDLTSRKNQYFQLLQEEFVQVDAEITSTRELLKQRQVSLSAMTVTAPVSGVVKQIGFSTVGAVVKATDVLIEIVPESEELVVEARILPGDIAFVSVGQSASMIFDTYDASVYGSASGEVIFISPDSIVEERPSRSDIFFPARVKVSTDTMFDRGDVELVIKSGMTGSVEIKTGRSTVLAYLLKPLVKTFSQSMGER
jgi:adhesin transport system membrane fusion protein